MGNLTTFDDDVRFVSQEEITKLTRQISTLIQMVSRISGEDNSSALASKLDALNASLENTDSAYKTIQDDIASLKEAISTAAETKDASYLESFSEKLKSIDTQNIENTLTSITSEISSLKEEIAAIGATDAADTQNREQIDAVLEKLAALEEKLTTKDAGLTEFEKERLDRIEQAVKEDYEKKISTIFTNFNHVKKSIDSVSGDIKTLGETIQTSTADNKKIITQLRGSVSETQSTINSKQEEIAKEYRTLANGIYESYEALKNYSLAIPNSVKHYADEIEKLSEVRYMRAFENLEKTMSAASKRQKLLNALVIFNLVVTALFICSFIVLFYLRWYI